ncbi:unnamed protein product, partial [Cyprideis torosa]
EEYQLDYLTSILKIPYVALISGIVMGGGVGISVHGPFRVATETTLFAMPETAIGLFPDVGGSYFLPRLKGHLGLFLALTGHRLKGADVYHAGIATHYVHSSSLPQIEEALTDLPAPVSNEAVDKVLKSFQVGNIPEFGLKERMFAINMVFSGESVDAILTTLEKEGSPWSLDMRKTLLSMSPTSLKLTFEQLRRGASMSLKECLIMEARMGNRIMQEHDFYEGVRATLIDKDKSPKWKPPHLSMVSDEQIDKYFLEEFPDLDLDHLD